ncbi:MAG: dynamin family protein [Proteobacteria bacterium]|nr:dynamin family protein [Pseudomonadota bacterium]
MIGIGDKYKRHKDNVIDLFGAYKEKREEGIRDGIRDGVNFEYLESRIHSLINGKYTLVVAGEVKAGKSTFLNALLGTEILPADVLQATSTILEIFKADKSFLKIKYASGREEEIYDDITTLEADEVKEKLWDICSIPDQYRQIPITLLNEIITSADEKPIVNDDLINHLEKKSGMHLKQQKVIITHYIDNHDKINIPIEIQFGYPLRWKFDELRLVDAPGVNATGGVQDISFDYFRNANAILFVHPIKPVESKSFRDFVKSVIPDRNQNTLFLVLTHAGHHFEEVDRLLNEARRLYQDIIPAERILAVDSILKIIHDGLESGKDLKQIKTESTSKKQVIPFFREKAEDEGLDLSKTFLKCSRFEELVGAIDDFSMKAPNDQLSEILDKIRGGYNQQFEQYNGKLERLNIQKRNPQEFEVEINRINEALTKYENLMHVTNNELHKQFEGRNSEWVSEKIDPLGKYQKLILNSNTKEAVRKTFGDAINEITSINTDFLKSLTQTLISKLETTGRTFKGLYKITLPTVDLDAIEAQALKEAYKKEDIYESMTEGLFEHWNIIKLNWTKKSRTKQEKVGEEDVYTEDDLLNSMKIKFHLELENILDALKVKPKEITDIYLMLFNKEMLEEIAGRKIALDEELNKKKSNQEIINNISEINKKKDVIKEYYLKKIEEILEDLK